MSKEMKGRRYKNASGRETYEVFDAERNFLEKVARILKSRFGFAEQGKCLVGLDEFCIDFANGDVVLVLDWDNWSGCCIYAKQPSGDEHVIAIGQYIEGELNTL